MTTPRLWPRFLVISEWRLTYPDLDHESIESNQLYKAELQLFQNYQDEIKNQSKIRQGNLVKNISKLGQNVSNVLLINNYSTNNLLSYGKSSAKPAPKYPLSNYVFGLTTGNDGNVPPLNSPWGPSAYYNGKPYVKSTLAIFDPTTNSYVGEWGPTDTEIASNRDDIFINWNEGAIVNGVEGKDLILITGWGGNLATATVGRLGNGAVALRNCQVQNGTLVYDSMDVLYIGTWNYIDPPGTEVLTDFGMTHGFTVDSTHMYLTNRSPQSSRYPEGFAKIPLNFTSETNAEFIQGLGRLEDNSINGPMDSGLRFDNKLFNFRHRGEELFASGDHLYFLNEYRSGSLSGNGLCRIAKTEFSSTPKVLKDTSGSFELIATGSSRECDDFLIYGEYGYFCQPNAQSLR